MRRSTKALAVAALFLLPVAGLAQTIGGSVAGRVLADSGQALSGVSVTARNVGTGATRTAVTDASGTYKLAELTAGSYEFTVESKGFATEVRSGVKITIGQRATLDFSLKVSAVAETVTVVGEAPIVETTKSSIGASISRQQLDQLPLPGRDFESLASLAPGITPSVTDGSTISGSGSSGASNTFLIDGVSNDQDALGNARGDYSPDAIAEYEVLSSSYSAQYGQASGAIVNVITRSGGNDFHGRASAYYRADGLTANDPFAAGAKTPFDQWIASAFLGGPVVKDKAFFFGSFEETWRNGTAVVGVDPALLESLGLGNQTTFPNDLTEPRVVLKLDYHPTNSQMLTFRFRLDDPKETNTNVGQTAIGRPLTGETGATLKTDNMDYGLSHSWVISSDTLNEARFQYSTQDNDITQVNCPGCPLIIRPSLISGKLPNLPQKFTEDRYQVLDSLSFTMGNHFLKAGVDYSHIKVDAFVPQNFDGEFLFTTNAPFNPDDGATYPFIFLGGGGNPNIDIANNIVALFVQDEWRVSPYLTLNVGLRWDYEDQTYVKHDWQNFGPRVHFAWDATKDGKTSIRGGFGIYYDQVFLNVPLLAELFAPGRFTSRTIIYPGYPNPDGPNPNFPGGIHPEEPPPNVSIVDPNATTPYKNLGSLGIQREVGPNMAVSADLVYARGYHLLSIRDANAAHVGCTPNPATGACDRPDLTIGQALEPQTEGKSEYAALQIGFVKRFSDCISAQLAYNLSSNRSDTDGSQAFPSDNYNRSADWGPSLNDIRHTLTAAVNWTGPWGLLLGASTTFLSGAPYNITTGTDDNGDGNPTERPPGVKHNSGRGASNWGVNAQLGKVFPITGSLQVQALVEVFNIFNRTNPTGYVGVVSPELGQATRSADILGLGPRTVQVGLRIDF
jgi:outer membrane receptor for ferrienterochelin and colicin